LLDIPFITTIGNAQFLDVFCIFEYQENKQFFHFLSIDSRELSFRDDAVRPLCKDNNLLVGFFGNHVDLGSTSF